MSRYKTAIRLIFAGIVAIAAAICTPRVQAATLESSDMLCARTYDNRISATDTVASAEKHIPESIFPEASRSLIRSHFTWGAELGASIDVSGNDLSTFNIDVLLGYKNDWIRIAGIGAGVHRSFGRSNMLFPIYAVFRSSFRSRPSLFFFSAKAGYSFNSIEGGHSKGGFKSSLGAGINLAMAKQFQSHIILSCGYFRLDKAQALSAGMTVRGVTFAEITFGMNF